MSDLINIMNQSINVVNDYSNEKIIYDTIVNPSINLAYRNPIIITEFNTNKVESKLVPIIQNCRELDILYEILSENNVSCSGLNLRYCIDKNILQIIEGYEKMGNLLRYTPILTKKKLKYFCGQNANVMFDLTIYNKESINNLSKKYLNLLLNLASRMKITNSLKDLIFNKQKISINDASACGEINSILVPYVVELLGSRILTIINLRDLFEFQQSKYFYKQINSLLYIQIVQYFNEINLQNGVNYKKSDFINTIINIIDYTENLLSLYTYCKPDVIKILSSLNVIQDVELFWELFSNVINKNIKIKDFCLMELTKIIFSKITSNPKYLTTFIKTFLPCLTYPNQSSKIPALLSNNCDIVYQYFKNVNLNIEDPNILEELVNYINSRYKFNQNSNNIKDVKLLNNLLYVQSDAQQVICDLLQKNLVWIIKRKLIKIYKLDSDEQMYLELLLHLQSCGNNTNEILKEIEKVLKLCSCNSKTQSDILENDYIKNDIILLEKILLHLYYLTQLCQIPSMRPCSTCLDKNIKLCTTEYKNYIKNIKKEDNNDEIQRVTNEFLPKLFSIINNNNLLIPIYDNFASELDATKLFIETFLLHPKLHINKCSERFHFLFSKFKPEMINIITKYENEGFNLLPKIITYLFSFADKSNYKGIILAIQDCKRLYNDNIKHDEGNYQGNHIVHELFGMYYKVFGKDNLYVSDDLRKDFQQSIEKFSDLKAKINLGANDQSENKEIDISLYEYAKLYVNHLENNKERLEFDFDEELIREVQGAQGAQVLHVSSKNVNPNNSGLKTSFQFLARKINNFVNTNNNCVRVNIPEKILKTLPNLEIPFYFTDFCVVAAFGFLGLYLFTKK